MIEQGKHGTQPASYKKPTSKSVWRRGRRIPAKARRSILERDVAGTLLSSERVMECQQMELSLIERRIQSARQSMLPVVRLEKSGEPEQYDKWKAVLERFREEIEKTDYTRQVVWRVKSVQKICEAGIAGCAFSLLMKWFTGVELVNSAFAVFLCFSLSVYWAMAWVKNRKLSSEP